MGKLEPKELFVNPASLALITFGNDKPISQLRLMVSREMKAERIGNLCSCKLRMLQNADARINFATVG